MEPTSNKQVMLHCQSTNWSLIKSLVVIPMDHGASEVKAQRTYGCVAINQIDKALQEK